ETFIKLGSIESLHPGRRGGALINLTSLLETLAQNDGSDLHLKAGSPPIIRVDGVLRRLEGRPLTSEDTEMVAHSIMPAHRREQLEKQNESDFAHSLTGLGRFRVNVFRQRGSVSLVLRRVRIGSASFEELGLPPVIRDLADAPRGMILVTGPTG